MNGNFKYSMTDEQRNRLKRKLTGKSVKGLASRGDVCALLQKELDRLIGNGQIGDKVADAMADCIPPHMRAEPEPIPQAQLDFTAEDYTPAEVAEVIKQNKLLLTRINILQYRLDLSVAA